LPFKFNLQRYNAATLNKARRMVVRFTSRLASAAYSGWLEWCYSRRTARGKLARIATRWRRVSLAAAFESWTAWVADLNALQALVMRWGSAGRIKLTHIP
jgi:hypothetical protein